MKHILIILSFISLVSSCSSFETKEDVIIELENFVIGVEQNKQYLTPSSIETYDAELMELENSKISIHKTDMSSEEIRKVNELIGKYKASKVKIYAKQVKQQLKDAFQQGKAISNELLPDSNEVEEALRKTEGFIKELSEEIKK